MTLAELVYTEIRDQLLDGRLAPGQQLGEVALAAQMGTSRCPVREALTRLRAEGLLVRADRGMLAVVQPRLQDVVDLAGLRASVERYAAGRAAERATPGEREALLSLGRAADGPGNTDAEEIAFHSAVVQMARLSPLAQVFQTSTLVRYAWAIAVTGKGCHGPLLEHTHVAIAEAIQAGDADAAEELAYQHALTSRDEFAQMLMLAPGSSRHTAPPGPDASADRGGREA